MNALAQIAEDDAEIAGILEAYFQREGFRTPPTRDGQVALDLHAALKPDCCCSTSPCRAWTASRCWPASAREAIRR